MWVGPTSCNAPKSLIRWYYVFLFRPYPNAVKLSYFPIYHLFFSFSFFNALFGNRRGKIKLFRHDSFFYLVGIIVNKWGESGRSEHPSRPTFLIWAEIRRERQVKSLQFLRTPTKTSKISILSITKKKKDFYLGYLGKIIYLN